MARDGRIDPVIGRDEEIEQTIEVLARRGKNNPVLIGEAGVGKTAIVEGLAQRIADGDVPDEPAGPARRRSSTSRASSRAPATAATSRSGSARIIDEIRAHSEELIVFIDELHTVVGAGGGGTEGGSMDASNMLKPPLARGELHVIGATTLEEYRRHIEKDAALARRFQPVLVPEPSASDAVEILRGLRDRYEAHHQVRYTDEALIAAVELSDRYLTGRYLPDKAIDLMDQAGARVRLRSATRGTDVRALEREAEQVGRDKDQAVAAEDYERATQLRDRLAELEERDRPGRAQSSPRRPHRRGHRRGHRRHRLPADRHPRQQPHPGGEGAAAGPGGPAARAGHRPGRGGRRRRRRGAALPGRTGQPRPADRQLPLPRPHRRRQDRTGPRAGGGAVRHARTGWCAST